MSVTPPGGYGTMISTALDGKAICACTAATAVSATSALAVAYPRAAQTLMAGLLRPRPQLRLVPAQHRESRPRHCGKEPSPKLLRNNLQFSKRVAASRRSSQENRSRT